MIHFQYQKCFQHADFLRQCLHEFRRRLRMGLKLERPVQVEEIDARQIVLFFVLNDELPEKRAERLGREFKPFVGYLLSGEAPGIVLGDRPVYAEAQHRVDNDPREPGYRNSFRMPLPETGRSRLGRNG